MYIPTHHDRVAPKYLLLCWENPRNAYLEDTRGYHFASFEFIDWLGSQSRCWFCSYLHARLIWIGLAFSGPKCWHKHAPLAPPRRRRLTPHRYVCLLWACVGVVRCCCCSFDSWQNVRTRTWTRTLSQHPHSEMQCHCSQLFTFSAQRVLLILLGRRATAFSHRVVGTETVLFIKRRSALSCNKHLSSFLSLTFRRSCAGASRAESDGGTGRKKNRRALWMNTN